MKRFNGKFVDSVLILMWMGLGVILLWSLLYMAFPRFKNAFEAQMTNTVMVQGTSLLFMGGTAVRVLMNWEHSLWTLPVGYLLIQVVYVLLYTYAVIPRPINLLWAPVIPTCFLAMVTVPLAYIWERIKPPRIVRVPVPRRRHRGDE
jgi:peptidoglycan/LPS O-acetylase OafA/YrhL